MRVAALLLGAALVVGGCSAVDRAEQATDDSAAEPDQGDPGDGERLDSATGAISSDGEAAPGDDAAADEAEDTGGDTGGSGVVTFGGSGDAAGRQLARTASIVLEVEDIEQAAAQVTAAAQRAGGFVSGAEVRGGDFGFGMLTLRVPARSLDATITDLADIGLRVVESSISTEDLTDRLTDLQARIDNLERLETELQALLADVRDTDPQATQLLQVFERLNEVRGEIERLEAQRTAAQDRVSLATIHVELLLPANAPEEVEPEPEGTLAEAWQTTRDAFGTMADALIWLVVTILPVTLVVVGVPALLLWGLLTWVRRRRQERTTSAPAPPVPPTGPSSGPSEGPSDGASDRPSGTGGPDTDDAPRGPGEQPPA